MRYLLALAMLAVVGCDGGSKFPAIADDVAWISIAGDSSMPSFKIETTVQGSDLPWQQARTSCAAGDAALPTEQQYAAAQTSPTFKTMANEWVEAAGKQAWFAVTPNGVSEVVLDAPPFGAVLYFRCAVND
jgi:hypothetical protein